MPEEAGVGASGDGCTWMMVEEWKGDGGVLGKQVFVDLERCRRLRRRYLL